MIVYLAGPVDYEEDKGKGWREEIIKLCEGHRTLLLYSPQAPFSFSKATPEISKYIHDVNMAAMHHADMVVAKLMRKQASVGTPIELYETAVRQKKPVVVITDMADSVYMQYIGIYGHLVNNINEAYGLILKTENKREEHLAKFRSGTNSRSATLGESFKMEKQS
jgi:nucleoside 2-deoxyribosyltransferase